MGGALAVSGPLYIINPAAFGGRGPEAWTRFRSRHADLPGGREVTTNAPGHAREIAASAGDCELVIAVGGDGTVGEAISGIMERARPRPRLAIVPAGTGNDIARVAGILSVDDAAAALREGVPRRFDLIRVDCLHDGKHAHRYAFLASYVGFSVVSSRTLKPWMKRLLGAKKAYYLATILGIIRYRLPHVIVKCGDRQHEGRTWMVIVGNVDRIGGGSMCVAPGASPDDGMLNVSIISAMSKLAILRKLPGIATGKHVDEPEVSYFPGEQLEVVSDPPASVEVDGDVCGTTPVTYTVCPKELEIMTPEQGDVDETITAE